MDGDVMGGKIVEDGGTEGRRDGETERTERLVRLLIPSGARDLLARA
jgi:hypothetical protein